MTLRQINTLLREGEIEELDPPMQRLVAVLTILREMDSGTGELFEASVAAFKKSYGAVTTESVDKFMELSSQVLDLDLDPDFIMKAMEKE